MGSRYVDLAASTAQTVVVSHGDPTLDEIADAPDRLLIPGMDLLEVINVDGDDIVYFTVDFAAGYNAASAGAIPAAPTIGGAGTTVISATPGEFVRIHAPREHNIAVVRAISAGTPRIGVSSLRHGGTRDVDPGGGAVSDYVPFALDANAADPHALILGLSPWGYWKMDDASGNPQDSSGNAHHATSVAATIAYHQAALTTKTAFAIKLSAGGRISLPVPSTNIGGPAFAFTLISLMQFDSDDEGLTANDDVFLSQQIASTAEAWGIHRVATAQGYWVFVNNAVQSGVSPLSVGAPSPPLHQPFVVAVRGSSLCQEAIVNGLTLATASRTVDRSDGTTFTIGCPPGGFFDMPGLTVGPTALWLSALSNDDLLAVTEALADDALLAAAWLPR